MCNCKKNVGVLICLFVQGVVWKKYDKSVSVEKQIRRPIVIHRVTEFLYVSVHCYSNQFVKFEARVLLHIWGK